MISPFGTGRVKPSSSSRIQRDLRASRILQDRLGGRTLSEIAVDEGLSIGRVAQIINVTLEANKVLMVGKLRRLESERLDSMQAAIWPQVLKGGLKATLVAISISARRSRLLGLDATAASNAEEDPAESLYAGEQVRRKLMEASKRLEEEDAARTEALATLNAFQADATNSPQTLSLAGDQSADIWGDDIYAERD